MTGDVVVSPSTHLQSWRVCLGFRLQVAFRKSRRASESQTKLRKNRPLHLKSVLYETHSGSLKLGGWSLEKFPACLLAFVWSRSLVTGSRKGINKISSSKYHPCVGCGKSHKKPDFLWYPLFGSTWDRIHFPSFSISWLAMQLEDDKENIEGKKRRCNLIFLVSPSLRWHSSLRTLE